MKAETAERADANFVVHATWAVSRTEGMTSRVSERLVIADSGLPCDTFNFVCRARLDPASARPAAAEAVDYFAGAGRPFSWWVGPADRPAELGPTLESLGLERAETELAMAMPLESLPVAIPPVPGLEVRRVRTADDLALLAKITAANWTPPDPDVLRFYQRTAASLLSPSAPQWFYLGLLEGDVVATAEATVDDGTVGLYNIATRADVRGRGIGSTMTWQPLRDARAAGCDLAILQAAAEGVGLYRRLGFDSFGTITEYKPAPAGVDRSTS
jgi:ribosomal protein S18 acetylase RimI-like enzyme